MAGTLLATPRAGTQHHVQVLNFRRPPPAWLGAEPRCGGVHLVLVGCTHLVLEDLRTTRKSFGQFWKETKEARRDHLQDKSLVAPGLQQYQGAVTWPRSGRLTCMLHCNRQSRSSRFLSRGMGHAPHCSGPVLSVPSDPYHCNSHRGQTSARQRP